jgi:pimeloyl-ACP methyl ester carboxylesterase
MKTILLINQKLSSIKEYLKKNKLLALALIILFTLLFIFIVYRVYINIHFLLEDDIQLKISSEGESLDIHYRDKPNITYHIEIQNSFLCKATCKYDFEDISSSTTLEKGIYPIDGPIKRFEKTFQLSVDRAGKGQKLYSFTAECNNVRTYFCPTNEEKRKKTSILTLNYDLSDYEQFLKETLKMNITQFSAKLSVIDKDIQELNAKFFDLGFQLNLNEFAEEKESLNNEFNRIVLEFENIERIWSEEDYLLLEELVYRDYDERISNINLLVDELNEGIDETLRKHNDYVERINTLGRVISADNYTRLYFEERNISLLREYKKIISRINKIGLEISENRFSNYTFLSEEIKSIEHDLMLQNKRIQENFRSSYLHGEYLDYMEKSYLCNLKSICLDKIDFPSAIINSINVDYSKVVVVCDSLEYIKSVHKVENNKSSVKIANYNLDEVKPIIGKAKEYSLSKSKEESYKSITQISASYEQNISLNILLNISKFDGQIPLVDYGNFAEKEILGLVDLDISSESKILQENFCKVVAQVNESKSGDSIVSLEQVKYVTRSNFTSRVNIVLTPNYPICCVFGECKRCCTQHECRADPQLYPVLFLHGHAFNSDNSPDFSLDAFNKIQSKLQEEGFITAGTITPISDYREIKKGDWGISSKPISVKGSYYLVSYYNLGDYSLASQKSESIETYAIRLKELIDILKFRTGRDKVNILAHSMGALVARSYIQIFGEDDVDKMILIASPNKGISGRVAGYCPVLGEKKECHDMSSESIFIKRINDPAKQPKKVNITNIVGLGCSNGNLDGDGIVTKRNAELDSANNYYINGSCPSISRPLHSQILDIDLYPEVYNLVKSALDSN